MYYLSLHGFWADVGAGAVDFSFQSQSQGNYFKIDSW